MPGGQRSKAFGHSNRLTTPTLSLEWRANDFILYGRGGEIATNQLEDQEATMLALHLLQNCMVYVNTLMLQRVLGEPIWLEHMGTKEQRALTPLFLGSREPLWHLPARHDRSSTT